MKTVSEVLQLSTNYLQERQVARPRREAEDLLCFILKLSRLELYLQHERPMDESELSLYRDFLKRKVKGEPYEYIAGEIPFFHCRFRLSPDVLIPRPETEILLEKAVLEIQKKDYSDKVAWDLCCGSGCLGVSLKKALPALEVSLSDLSEKAIEIAKANASMNDATVCFYQGDLLSPFRQGKADFVLCNPPYISNQEFNSLDPSVRLYEPKIALVSGPSGLEFYTRLADELPVYLNRGAKVFLEIGAGQGAAVGAIFGAKCWKTKCLEKDWAGHDRFFFLEFE
ncbi:MAG TPA: peptide chain release factor N(5)-glutamine methyltransferase [Rhabdochlamydiaceae bacterium]|nr:peptide chain release factor N(5)-glutamine methyltransferase [Rhabdochlamydiaceae bacterium]